MKICKQTFVLAAGFGGLLAATALCAVITVADPKLAAQAAATQLPTYPAADQLPRLLLFLAKLRQNLPENSILWGVCAAALAWVFYRLGSGAPQRFSLPVALLSALFGLVQVAGLSMFSLGGWAFITANAYQVLFSILCMAGYAVLFYFAFLGLCRLLSRTAQEPWPRAGSLAGFWCAHTRAAATGAILLGWSPWLIACLPGSVSWDSAFQVEQFFGAAPMTAQHTVCSTWLHGLCFGAGHLLGSDNLGVFFYVALQTAVCAVVYGAIVAFAKKLNAPLWVQGGITAFFALVPAWGAYAQAVTKDTLFTGVFAAFVLLCANFIVFPQEFGKRLCITLCYYGAAFLACLLRKNGSYAVLPCLVLTALLVFSGRQRRQAAVGTLAVLACLFSFQFLTGQILQIPAGSISEALSVPFQQTARYIKEYGEEVTPAERAAIDAVLDYDALAQAYKPYLSDPVKATYHGDPAGGAALNTYLKTWAAMFFKHPVCYLEALHANSYGYYTIGNTGIGNVKEQYYAYIKSDYLAAAGLNVYYLFEPGAARYVLYNWALTFDALPLLGLLTSRGFCSWVAVALAACFIRQRRKTFLLAAIPVFLLLLTCVASPVDDLLRYYLPVLACIPILTCLALYAFQRREPVTVDKPLCCGLEFKEQIITAP